MAHPEQRLFFEELAKRFSTHFQTAQTILEVGSQNINGSIRDFFSEQSTYLGIDIGPAQDVDLIIPGELIQLPTGWADISVSTECFEHAKNWKDVLANMIRVTKPTGLVILTFAGFGRATHGTLDSEPESSPFTVSYYKNLVPDDIYQAIQIGQYFSSHAFEVNSEAHDTYFWGIRNNQEIEAEPDSIRTLEEKLVRAQGQLGQSIEKIASLRLEVDNRNATIAHLHQELKEREATVVKLEQQLAEQSTEVDQLNQRLADQSVEFAQFNQQFNQQLRAGQVERDSLSLQTWEQQTKLDRLNQQLTERETELNQFQQWLTERDEALVHFQRLLAEQEVRGDNLTHRLQEQEATLMAITQTVSWRITAPLRQMALRFPQLARANRRLLKLIRLLVTFRLYSHLLKQVRQRRAIKQGIPILQASGLFDTDWYLAQNPDVAEAGINSLLHYLHPGVQEGRDPNPLFDTDWYLAQNPDVARAGINPLLHYLHPGVQEGRDPNPLFDTDWYLAQNPDVAEAGINPLLHYLHPGAQEGRDPNPLFDTDWYLAQNPDVAEAEINPLLHYLCFGAQEGRDPNPLFDTDWYLAQNPDVGEVGINPLLHYLCFGVQEGRDPNPLFDTNWYLAQNPDVAEAGINPLAHYLSVGASEGRKPHNLFDTSWYLTQYPDVARTGLNPLYHYLRFGQTEGRHTTPIASRSCLGGLFDSQFYRASHLPEISNSDAETHYITQGVLQGAAPNPRIARKRLERLSSQPLISILMPVYNSPRGLLQQAVDSVQQQVYENWELWLQDDGSIAQDTLELLEELAHADPRIHVALSTVNQGIAAATNRALDMARGEFVAMMDHDDLLTPDCLLEVVAAHNRDLNADVFYTDQACVNDDGSFTHHQYKPDWSPWMFRGVMFIGHLLVVRRQVALGVGGFDSAFDFVQDFEFMLRVSEVTDRIIHLPRVLYYWRQTAASVAGGGKTSIDFGQLQTQAVNDHLTRLHLPVLARKHPVHPHRTWLEPTQDRQSISIRILTMPAPTDQASSSVAIQQRWGQFTSQDQVQWTDLTAADMQDGSRLAGLLEHCSCDVWVFINSLCQPLQDHWLTDLASYVTLPGVGAAGPLLLGVDGTVASAGMIVSRDGVRPAMSGFDPNSDGYAGSLSCVREVSALAPDCIALRRDVLRLEGGLQPEFGLAYNLLDTGLRCQRAKLANLLVPFVQVRWTTETGSCLDRTPDGERFWRSYRYPQLEAGDRFYNPNLDLNRGDYTLIT